MKKRLFIVRNKWTGDKVAFNNSLDFLKQLSTRDRGQVVHKRLIYSARVLGCTINDLELVKKLPCKK